MRFYRFLDLTIKSFLNTDSNQTCVNWESHKQRLFITINIMKSNHKYATQKLPWNPIDISSGDFHSTDKLCRSRYIFIISLFSIRQKLEKGKKNSLKKQHKYVHVFVLAKQKGSLLIRNPLQAVYLVSGTLMLIESEKFRYYLI